MFKYKAQTVTGEWIEVDASQIGSQHIGIDGELKTITIQVSKQIQMGREKGFIFEYVEIKPETLRIKINDKLYTQEELEELVKPKSCESCKYSYEHYKQSLKGILWCDMWNDGGKQVEKKDYCSRYEPKNKS